MSDLAFAGIAELAPRIATGEVSPVALTALMLERIEAHEPTLNAYITVMANEARADAETAAGEIAAGGIRGPLHGIPIAVKDLFATRGTRTTFGSLLYADWVPDYDATVVERLRAAGAVIIGKTNLHELAFGTTSINAHHGAVRNPWRTDCHPGGSSGGSAAAVAAGLAFGAMGSDTGASIRQPEHCCAIVGLKPTFGRVPKYGALPLSWSMDHVGPMTRSVADAALMLEVLAGHDPRDPGSADKPVEPWSARLASDPKGKRLGIPRAHFFENCEVDVMAAVEAAIGLMADLGAEPVDVALPDMDAALAAGNVIIMAEAHACYRADLERDPSLFSDEVAATLEVAGFLYRRAAVAGPAPAPPPDGGDDPGDAGDRRPGDAYQPDSGDADRSDDVGAEPGADPEHYSLRPDQPARRLRALRFHWRWPAGRFADRGPALRRGGCVGDRARLRTARRLARPPAPRV